MAKTAFMPKSATVATYDMQPEMSCGEVTDHFVQAIKDRYRLDRGELCKPRHDRAHRDSGCRIAACEAVDTGLGRVLEAR